jgi:signal transduction histidine kinase
MRTRLSVLLLVLMGVVLVSLGVPLGATISSTESRAMHADRVTDLAIFVGLVPSGPRLSQVEANAAERDLRRYDELYGISVSVYDAAGRLRLQSRDQPWSGSTAEAVRSSVQTALAGRLTEAPPRMLPWENRPLVAAQSVVRDGDVVGAVVSVSPVDQARDRVLDRWLLLVGAELVALVGAAVLAGRLAGWLLRPVARLDEAAHQISAGDLGARVPTGSGPPELRRLEHSFNDMAVHVQGAVEAQRAFIADASHQLRNPLAALLIRLEGLRLAPPARQSAAAESALADGRHLAGTLDRMLALAQVEHISAAAGPVDVGRVVDERLSSWRVVADSRSITIHRTGVSRVLGHHDTGALSGALDAVLDNSLKYSPEHSAVTVEVTIGESTIAIVVTDDGPGVSAEDLPKVVDRFWRSAEAARETGSGLGMSIAKTLLERHGGRLDIGTTDDRGLRVSLRVPLEAPDPVDQADPGNSGQPAGPDDDSNSDDAGAGDLSADQGLLRR